MSREVPMGLPCLLRSEEELRACLSKRLQEMCDSISVPGMSPNQKLVLLLQLSAHDGIKSDLKGEDTGCFIVASSVVICLVTVLIYSLLLAVERNFPESGFSTVIGWLLYLGTAVLLLLSHAVHHSAEQRWVNLYQGGKLSRRLDSDAVAITGMHYGKLWYTTESFNAHALGMVLLVLFITQAILTRFSQDHVGIAGIASFRDAALVSLDNLLNGLLFDVFELYNIHISKMPENALPWTATILMLFRTLYGVICALIVVSLYRRRKLAKLYENYPGSKDLNQFLDWMESLCRDENNWGRTFHDDMIFHAISEEYLRGNFDTVKHMARQFASIDVSDDVRELFVHPKTGEALFPPRR
jgi:hypothetical protein